MSFRDVTKEWLIPEEIVRECSLSLPGLAPGSLGYSVTEGEMFVPSAVWGPR
jgi:hypothetical protein